MSLETVTEYAYQWVFDNAESINFNRKATVGQTISRSNVIRSVSRGGQAWRFEVKMPDGISWTAARSYIEAIDQAGRVYPNRVKMNNAGYSSWLSAYRGNSSNLTGWTCTATLNSQVVTLTNTAGIASGYTFKAGDFVQLDDGDTDQVYTVVENVEYPATSVTLHRPVNQDGACTMVIGPQVEWYVLCSEVPQWTIFSRDQVSWSGPFVFYEVA